MSTDAGGVSAMSAELGQQPGRAGFDLHDCAMGYAYTEITDPAGPDDWSTDDVVKAFKAGFKLAQRQERDAVAAERERIAAHFDERDKGPDGQPLGLGCYDPHEPAEIIRALGPNAKLTGQGGA